MPSSSTHRPARPLLLLLVAAIALTSCGLNLGPDRWVTQDVYRPAAFGENGQCYYVLDPNEVDALIADGLCQPAWRVTPAPAYWVARYAPYYDSPAYYDVYVRPDRRPLFRERQVAWEKVNSGLISSERARSTWVNAKGTPVAGTKVDYAKASFGSGRLRSTGFSAGGLRAPGGSGTGPPPRVKVIQTGRSLVDKGVGMGGTRVRTNTGFTSGSVRIGGKR